MALTGKLGSLASPASRQGLAIHHLGAWSGVIGSVLFVAVFTIEGWLRPGYDAAGVYISALSMGQRGWIQITNFIVTGLFIVLFAQGIAAEFGKAARTGVTLLRLIGISLVASGPLVMDPMTVPFSQMSAHSKLHYLFGAIVFSLAPASCFVFFTSFGSVPGWRRFRWWTFGVGIFMVTAIVLLKIAALSLPSNEPQASTVLQPWLGAIQRATIIPFFIWVFTFGLALLRRLRREQTGDSMRIL